MPASRLAFPGIAIAVFALMVVIDYLPVFTGRIPFPQDLVLRHSAWDQRAGSTAPKPSPEIGDLMTSFYPYHALVARAAEQGNLPLWNPYTVGGAPLLGNSQSAPFYPFNLPYYILPLNLAWTVCLALRLFFAALFMAILVRSIGASTTGSIVSGLIFSLCGFMTAWQGQAMGDAAIWLPMICYAVRRLHQRLDRKSIALAAVSFAMPTLAGHPETAVHLTLTGCVFAVLLGWHRFDKRFLAYFTLAGLLALGLAAVTIVPTLEWFGEFGLSLEGTAPILSRHDGQGFFSRDLHSSPSSALIPIPEAASYLGMFGLMAASLSLFHRSRRQVLFFGTSTIIAAAIAFGIEPAHWIASHLPILKIMKNGRLILVASFGVAALAGLGISTFEDDGETFPARKRRFALAAMGGMFLVAAAGIYEVHRATFVSINFMRGPWGSAVFLLAATGLLIWRLCGGLRGRFFPILVCGLAGLELLSFSFGYTDFTRHEDVFPTAPVFKFLQSRGNPSTFRFAKSGYPIPANSGIMYQLESADGYEITTDRARAFNAGLIEERDDAIFYEAKKVAESQDRRLDMLNVKYWAVIAGSPDYDQFAKRPEKYKPVFKEGSVAVFETTSALPRLFAVPASGIDVASDGAAQMARIKDPRFKPEETALFSERPASLAVEEAPASAFESDLQMVHSDMNSYSFRARTSRQSVLVLGQIYYPGWKARIDGTEVPVYPVDYALTGILAPAGEHDITLYFQPRSFRIGGGLSLAALCIVIGLSIPLRNRSQR